MDARKMHTEDQPDVFTFTATASQSVDPFPDRQTHQEPAAAPAPASTRLHQVTVADSLQGLWDDFTPAIDAPHRAIAPDLEGDYWKLWAEARGHGADHAPVMKPHAGDDLLLS